MTDASPTAAKVRTTAQSFWKWRQLRVALLVAGAIVFGIVFAYRSKYPYGYSHSCDKQLMFALHQYAQKYDGWFPAGADSPEASLSLLARENLGMEANVLRGKIVPFKDVDARLKRGELLTHESCGWHYVEGLRMDDDDRLGLFWDKVGLDHNGGVLPNGDQIVWFASLTKERIPGVDWQKFLADQKRLRDEVVKWRAAKRPTE